MPQLNAGQLVSLRQHPQKIGCVYLYVFQPPTVFAAQVNGGGVDPGYDVQHIPFDNVTAGAIGNVRRGHTLWIGSAPGLKDGGIIRVRSNGVGATVDVGEHEIYLYDNVYITVKDEFKLWHVSPFITNAGVIYKDCDDITAPSAIVFPGANQIYQPVPVLGPHSIEVIESGVATHHFDWSRSWAIAPGATIASYAATFPGGTPPNSNAVSGTVTWNTPGARWVDLVVIDSNGVASYAGHRLYITLDSGWRDEEGLYVSFASSPRQGDVSSGGFSMEFTIHVEASEDDFPDGALVIWFFDGGTQEDISGNWPYRSHVHFIGYIRRGSTHKEPETGNVAFEAETIQELMKSLPTFPNFLEINAAPTVWTQAASLTVQRAATLHMRWQSSLLEIADVLFVPAATTAIGEHEFPEGDLYSQLNSLVNRDYLYRIGCDPSGTVYLNKDPQFLPRPGAWLPPAGIDTIMTIGPQDWQGAIGLPEPLLPETAHVLGSGVAYAAGVSTPLFSHAPGPVPLEFGQKDTSLSRLILVDQAGLNVLTGLVLAQANNDFPDISSPLDGQYYIGHLFPMEFVGLNIYGIAIPYGTKRDVDLSGEKFIPRRSQLQVVYDEHGVPSLAMVSLNLEKLTYGVAGRTLLYPTSTGDLTVPGPDEGPSGGGWLPPAPPVPGSGGGGGETGSIVYLVLDNGHVIRVTEARDANPANAVYTDLGLVDAGGLYWIALDEFDPINNAMVCGPNGVWSTTTLADAAPVWNLEIALPGGWTEFTIVRSSPVTDQVWMAVCWLIGFGDVRVYWTIDDGANWNSRDVASVDCGEWPLGPPYLELSSHDANTAWVTFVRWNDGLVRCARTTNMWTSANCLTESGACIQDTNASHWPCSHHRYATNVADLVAIWGSSNYPPTPNREAVILYVDNDLPDVTPTCVILCAGVGPVTNGWLAKEVGCWIGSANSWWALVWCITNIRFFVSDDGTTWTEQEVWARDLTLAGQRLMRHAADWRWGPEWFYLVEDGDGITYGPLWISSDRAATWQRQFGNWNALCVAEGWTGAGEPDVRCVAPVWTV